MSHHALASQSYVRFAYLDSLSSHHPRSLRGSSIGMFQLRLRIERYVRRANERTHCSRCSQWSEHLRQILRGSRSDDRLRDLYRLLPVHRHRDVGNRRCLRIHHMDFPRSPRDRSTSSCQAGWGNPRWYRKHQAARTHRCLCTAPRRLPRILVCICMQSLLVSCSTQRSQRIVRLLQDLDTRRCLQSKQRKLETFRGEPWNSALQTFTVKTVADVSWEAGTCKTTEGIRTVSEYVTRSVFTLVLVWNLAVAAAEAIVTMALMVEAHSVRACRSIFAFTVVCRRKWDNPLGFRDDD